MNINARLFGTGAFRHLTLSRFRDGLAGTEFTLDGLGDVFSKVLEGKENDKYTA